MYIFYLGLVTSAMHFMSYTRNDLDPSVTTPSTTGTGSCSGFCMSLVSRMRRAMSRRTTTSDGQELSNRTYHLVKLRED